MPRAAPVDDGDRHHRSPPSRRRVHCRPRRVAPPLRCRRAADRRRRVGARRRPVRARRGRGAAGFDGLGLRLVRSPPVVRSRSISGGTPPASAHAARRRGIRLGSRLDPAAAARGRRPAAGAAVGAGGVRRRRPANDVDGVADSSRWPSPLGLVVGLEYMAWTDPSDAGGGRGGQPRHGLRRRGRRVASRACRGRPDASSRRCSHPVASGGCSSATRSDARRPTERAGVTEARHRRLLPGHGSLPLADLLAAFGPTDGRPTSSTSSASRCRATTARPRLAVDDRFRLLHDDGRSCAGRASAQARSGSEQHRVATEVRAGGRRVHLGWVVGIGSHAVIEHRLHRHRARGRTGARRPAATPS